MTPNTIATASLSNWEYFSSVAVSVRDANPTGLSPLFGISWDNTAPNPYRDASQDRMRGRLGSKLTSTRDDCSNLFTAWKASSSLAPHDHFFCFCSNAYKSESVFARSGRKLAVIIYKPQEGSQLGNISRRRSLRNPCNFGI